MIVQGTILPKLAIVGANSCGVYVCEVGFLCLEKVFFSRQLLLGCHEGLEDYRSPLLACDKQLVL